MSISVGRLRRRRRLLGLTQHALANACRIRFQQVQKYECGANRMSASRLWQLAEALQAPVSYFFAGYPALRDAADARAAGSRLDTANPSEAQDLIETWRRLGADPRRRLLEFAPSLGPDCRGP